MARQKRCKHCGNQIGNKEDTWRQIRIHIRPEKLFACDSCEFVTEHRHHLDYHRKIHAGLKPFKCESSDYRCINKSMLNSHLKSHSLVFAHRCGDCDYFTRYFHSLKQHLKKYGHQQQQQREQEILDLRIASKLH